MLHLFGSLTISLASAIQSSQKPVRCGKCNAIMSSASSSETHQKTIVSYTRRCKTTVTLWHQLLFKVIPVLLFLDMELWVLWEGERLPPDYTEGRPVCFAQSSRPGYTLLGRWWGHRLWESRRLAYCPVRGHFRKYERHIWGAGHFHYRHPELLFCCCTCSH